MYSKPRQFTSLATILLLLASGCTPKPASDTSGNSSDIAEQPTGDQLSANSGFGLQPGEDSAAETDQRVNLTQAPPIDSITSNAAAPRVASAKTPPPEQALLNRPFVTLRENPTENPAEIAEYLSEIDAAIQDLLDHGLRNMVDEQTYVSSGLRLGRLKLDASERLLNSADATTEQKKLGTVSKLISLSHMSGLRDVEAAKQLSQFAEELSSSSDPDLAHQSRVVLLGFEVQALQNGVKTDPNDVVAKAEGLFARPEDRNYPEFVALQNTAQVLAQLGHDDASKRVLQILASEYISSPNAELRGEAWSLATMGSRSVENFLSAMKPKENEQVDIATATSAARAILKDFPNGTSLEQLVDIVVNLEMAGQIPLSAELARVVRAGQETIVQEDFQAESIESKLSAHEARLGLLGKPLSLPGLVTFDGQAFRLSELGGKVVLIDFWASWCIPCHQELPYLREIYQEAADQGFQIVGVNMDQNLEDAERFLRQQKFPWVTLRPEDTTALGFQAEFAQTMGISKIPFIILLDADGKVAKLHVRQKQIAPAVRSLLGIEESLIID